MASRFATSSTLVTWSGRCSARRRGRGAIRASCFNVGGGPDNAVSLLELLDLLEERLDRRIERRFAEWRPGDQRIYVTRLERARRLLGWIPSVPVEQGIQRLANWVRANLRAVETPVPRLPQTATA